MRWLVLLIGIALVAGGLFLRLQEPARENLESLLPDPALLRRTSAGPVIGARTRRGAEVWLGIPYAAPPQGTLRWRAPQSPQPWRQPRDAHRFGAACPQFASRLAGEPGEPGELVGSEDCLSLNVFAPGGADERSALPVMVFIHGGGNTIGSSRRYDATRFAQEQGVVMVSLNYRLGALGWFSHPALRRTADDSLDASGNFALLDIVHALRWVQDNITAFGGDPARVTVFGESAGARNIYGLLASPVAAGLFHGAILQSGTAGTYTLSQAENPLDAPSPGHENSSYELVLRWLQGSGEARDRADATTLVQRLDDNDLLAFLRDLPLPELMAPLGRSGGEIARAPALFRDGTVLPAIPLLEVFAQRDGWNRVPLIAGTNRDEMKLFLALDERLVENRFGLLPSAINPPYYALLAGLYSDNWKALGVDEPLRAMQEGDPQQALFAYRFDWDAMRANWLVDLPELLGAAHGLELDFLFGPLFSAEVPGVATEGNRREREALGRAMRDYWAGFAYSGRPGSGRSATLPAWPRWRTERPLVMLLDEPGGAGLRPEPLQVRVEDVKARLPGAPLVPRERCALYVDLFLDNNGMPDLFSAREYQELGCAPFPARTLADYLR